MSKQTLLQKAKTFPSKYKKFKFSKEELDLAISWMKGEVSYNQVVCVIFPKENKRGHGRASGSLVYSWLARATREAFIKGILNL